jgi:hypothetical protein
MSNNYNASKKNLYDAFYNDGLFDNSKRYFNYPYRCLRCLTLGKDGEYAAVTSGATFATANDGSVRSVVLGVTGFLQCKRIKL